MQPTYPNPFRQETSFPINLSESSIVSIELYDLIGKMVASIIERKKMNTGQHNIKVSRNQLKSGWYMAKISVENTKGKFVETLKIMVK